MANRKEHPCKGCLHYYGNYLRCCNYIFDTGRKRPCGSGVKCTVKRPITGPDDLKLRKIGAN